MKTVSHPGINNINATPENYEITISSPNNFAVIISHGASFSRHGGLSQFKSEDQGSSI